MGIPIWTIFIFGALLGLYYGFLAIREIYKAWKYALGFDEIKKQ